MYIKKINSVSIHKINENTNSIIDMKGVGERWSFDLNTKTKIIGEVVRKGDHINALTQSIDVFVSINGDDLKDGMYGSGKILCDTISGVYKVERAKISQENSIYLLEDKTLRLKSIDIIVFQDDSVIIKGVNNNECIVNQYRHYFHDGMQIN